MWPNTPLGQAWEENEAEEKQNQQRACLLARVARAARLERARGLQPLGEVAPRRDIAGGGGRGERGGARGGRDAALAVVVLACRSRAMARRIRIGRLEHA